MPSIASTFSGVKTHCVIDTNGKLFAVIDENESYQNHFINNGYNSMSDQVSAGFPLFFEPGLNKNLSAPNLVNATYTEVFDFGIGLTNFTINLVYNKIIFGGDVLISFVISSSLDNISFTNPQVGETAFFTSGRYIQVVATFTPFGKHSAIDFENFICHLQN